MDFTKAQKARLRANWAFLKDFRVGECVVIKNDLWMRIRECDWRHISCAFINLRTTDICHYSSITPEDRYLDETDKISGLGGRND